jgi:hypothetical protein
MTRKDEIRILLKSLNSKVVNTAGIISRQENLTGRMNDHLDTMITTCIDMQLLKREFDNIRT